MKIKQLTLALVVSLSSLFCVTVNARAQATMDYPHDFQGCTTCHLMSAFAEPSMIPADPDGTGPQPPHTPANMDDSLYNKVCTNCHNGTDASIHYVHSSLTSTTKYGNWSVGCTTCHNPHSQDQPGGKFLKTQLDLSTIAGLAKTGVKGIYYNGPSTLADGGTKINGVCEICHTQTAYFRNDGSRSDGGVHSDLQGTDCTECHKHGSASFTPVSDGGLPCGSCHLVPPVAAPADMVSNTSSGAGTTGSTTAGAHDEHVNTQNIGCEACHYDYLSTNPVNHDDGNAPLAITIGFAPSSLRQGGSYDGQGGVSYDASVTSPVTTVTNGGSKQCGNIYCHSDGTFVSTNNAGQGVWNTPAWDGGVTTCASCHQNGPAYANAAPKANSHVAHVSEAGYTCDKCHSDTTTDGSTISNLNLHVNGAYNVKAKSPIKFTYTASSVKDGSGGACAVISCHGNMNAQWGVGEHVMPTDPLCLNCHTSTNDPYYNTGEVHARLRCATCHNASNNGALIGSAAGKVSGDGCMVCHNTYFNGHTHGHSMPKVTLCSGCHTAGSAPYVAASNVHQPGGVRGGNGCATCHNSGTGALQGSATGKVGGENCQNCHTNYFNNHGHGGNTLSPNHTESLSADAVCANCHGNGLSGPDAITAPYTSGANEAHKPSGCFTCHNSTNGAPKGSAINWGANWAATVNGTCTTCHTSAFNGHGHSHSMPKVTLCTSCHTAATAPYVAASDVHEPGGARGGNGCATCHAAGTGALQGSAAAKVGGENCQGCHTNYFTNHDHGGNTLSPNHTESLSVNALCANCHGNGLSGPDAITAPYTSGANEAHKPNGCMTCHNSANGAPTGSATNWGATWASTGTGTCTTCHTGSFNGHSHNHAATVVDNTVITPNTTNCAGCHAATASPFNGASQVHSASGCATCHDSGTGALRSGPNGDATVADGGIAADGALECGECHVTNSTFVNHTHHGAANNDVSFIAGTDKTMANIDCNTCHGADGADGGTAVLDSWSEILALHLDSCAKCHNYNGSNGVYNNTPAASVTTAITSGNPANCITCHTDKDAPDPHGSHTINDFPWTAGTRVSCGDDGRAAGACHNDGVNDDVILEVHKDNCALCHVDEPNNDYTRWNRSPASYDGNPADPLVVAAGRSAVCTDCHTTANFPAPFIHHRYNLASPVFNPATDCATRCHNSANSAAGNHTALVANSAEIPGVQKACNTCHIGVVGTADNVPVDNLNDQKHDACTQCHAINGATYIVQLVAPSGSVTTMNNPDGTTSTSNGGGTCMNCHTGYFEAHTHHDSGNNELAWLSNTPPVANPDVSWSFYSPCGGISAGQCHQDYTGDATSVTTWTGVKWEHDRTDGTKDGTGSCLTCHMSAKTGADMWNYTDVPDVVTTGVSVQCLNCHKQKESPANHGMTYVDHFITNTVPGQGTLGYPPLKSPALPGNAECIICHDTDLDANGGPDVIVVLHNNSCYMCHTNQPLLNDGSLGTPDLNNNANTGGYVCIDCHNDTNNTNFSKPFHGMAPTHSQINTRHNRTDTSTGAPYNCLACHTEMTPGQQQMLSRHMPGFVNENDCLVCHTGGATLAQTVVTAGSDTGGNTEQFCESCHTGKGQYRMHGLDLAGVVTEHNNLSTAGVTGDGDCSKCHTMGTITQRLNVHLTPVETSHSGGCLPCHTAGNPAAAAIVAGLPVDSDGGPVGGNTPQTCNACHTGAGVHIMHALDNAGTAAIHDKVLVSSNAGSGTETDCAECHTMGTATQRLALHPSCATTSCHDAGAPASTAIANGWPNVGGVGQNCEACHGSKGSHTMHGLAPDTGANGVVNEHDNLSTAGVTGDGDCANCHAMSTLTEKVMLHWNPAESNHAGTCLPCHKAGNPAAAAIVDGMSLAAGGNNNPQACNVCHTGTGVHLMHGADNASTAAIHENVLGSSGSGSANCGACHTASTAQQRLALHPTCSACHTEATSPATTAIAAGWPNTGGAGQNCEACHDTYGRYLLHGMTAAETGAEHDKLTTSGFAGADDCANCHVMTTGQDKIALHTSPVKTAHSGDCLTCHTGGADTAMTVINNGMSAGGNTAQTCAGCHAAKGDYLLHGLAAADSADVHNNLVNVIDAGVTSTCSTGAGSCHTIATVQNRIEVHTLGSTTCLTCHQYGGTVQAEIAAGYNNTNSTPCEDCHKTAAGLPNIAYNWYAHTDPDHTSAGLNVLKDNTLTTPNSENCVNCHSAASQVAIHDTVAPAASPNVCAECHDADSTLKGSGTVYTTGNFECNQCHTGYFDGHSHVHDAIHDTGTDLSGGAACYTCHTDNSDASGIALDSWTDIMGEHVSGCGRCHDYTDDGQGTPNVAVNYAQIGSAGTVKCLDCHVAKSAGHGGHDPSHFAWTAGTISTCGAAACHNATGNANVVSSLHGGVCAMCHPTSGGRDGGKLGNSFLPAVVGDSRPAASGVLDEDCFACHAVTIAAGGDANRIYQNDFDGAHVTPLHPAGTWTTAGCMGTNACHQGSNAADVTGTLHTACSKCHDAAWATTNGSLISGSTGTATGGQGDCVACHTSPADYGSDYTNHLPASHGALTNTASCVSGGCHDESNYIDAGQPGVGVHDMFDNASSTFACGLCHTSGSGILKNGSRGYGDATDTIGQCTNCHSAYGSNWQTGHDAGNLDHAALTGTATCVSANCHTQADYIDAGQPGVGVHDMNNNASSTYACDLCHNMTNGVLEAGPSGNGTAVGGAGNCASCHSAYSTNYTNHDYATPHTVFENTASCVAAGCHDQANYIDAGQPGVGKHDMFDNASSTYACDKCHASTTGALIGSAATGDRTANGSTSLYECIDCHTGGHNAELDHDKIHKSWTIANGATPIVMAGVSKSCDECHTQLGTAPHTFVGGIDQLHLKGAVDCNACHNYNEATGNAVATPQAAVQAAIANGKGAGGAMQNCESCHVDVTATAIPGHDAIKAHDYTIVEKGNYEAEGLSCARCHHGNIAVEHVTGGALCEDLTYTNQTTCESNGRFWNTNWGIAKGKIEGWDSNPAGSDICFVCHDDGAGGGNASHTVIDDAITAGKGGSFVSCFDCHNTGSTYLWQYDPDGTGPIVPNNPSYPKYDASYKIPQAHHDGTQVDTGNCTYCHTDPRVKLGNPTPAVLPCKDCHADENATSKTLTIYRVRNRGQDLRWTTKFNSGYTLDWTYSYNAMCSDSYFTTQATCEGSGHKWLPARAIANTKPSGTCSNSSYNDDKVGCIQNSGQPWLNNTAWTEDELAGSGVNHQWSIKTGGTRGPGTVQTYGMCIFCHKMAPFHAKNMASDDANPNAEDHYPYDNGYADAPFHPCTGRARFAVFSEKAALENQYYKAGRNPGSQSGNKGIYKLAGDNDTVSDVSFHYEMAVYHPQRICSDKRWKNQTDCTTHNNLWDPITSSCSDPQFTNQSACEAATGTWDHGDQAYKYIPSGYFSGTMAGQSGAETEHLGFVPIATAAPTTAVITDNSSAFVLGSWNTGSRVDASFFATGCSSTNSTMYLVFAGNYYAMTTADGGSTWSGSTGAVTAVGDIYKNKDFEAVCIDNATRAVKGNLHVTIP